MTARTVLWDGIAISGAFMVILLGTFGVKLALACIGTVLKDDEAHPVLVVMSWLHRASERVWPAVGRHVRDMLADDQEEETGDGAGGQAGDVRELRPADQDGAEVEGDLGSREDGRAALPPGDGGDPAADLREHHDEWASGRFTHKGEDGEEDLTGLSEEDTDTLRVFHELNEQHVVPSHEPTPETSAPAHTGGGDDPGPGGPDDTDPPGVAAEEAPGPGDQPEDTPSPATQPANADNPTGPGAKSPGPAERGVISGSDGPVPARLPAGPGDTLAWIIAKHLDAPAEMLAEWESQIAEHIAEAMATLRAVTA